MGFPIYAVSDGGKKKILIYGQEKQVIRLMELGKDRRPDS